MKSAHGYLYVPLGSDGLSVYKIQLNGDLQLVKTYGSVEIYGREMNMVIVDTTIGGPFGKSLFILDKVRGVSVWHMVL